MTIMGAVKSDSCRDVNEDQWTLNSYLFSQPVAYDPR